MVWLLRRVRTHCLGRLRRRHVRWNRDGFPPSHGYWVCFCCHEYLFQHFEKGLLLQLQLLEYHGQGCYHLPVEESSKWLSRSFRKEFNNMKGIVWYDPWKRRLAIIRWVFLCFFIESGSKIHELTKISGIKHMELWACMRWLSIIKKMGTMWIKQTRQLGIGIS